MYHFDHNDFTWTIPLMFNKFFFSKKKKMCAFGCLLATRIGLMLISVALHQKFQWHMCRFGVHWNNDIYKRFDGIHQFDWRFAIFIDFFFFISNTKLFSQQKTVFFFCSQMLFSNFDSSWYSISVSILFFILQTTENCLHPKKKKKHRQTTPKLEVSEIKMAEQDMDCCVRVAVR